MGFKLFSHTLHSENKGSHNGANPVTNASNAGVDPSIRELDITNGQHTRVISRYNQILGVQ